MLQQSASAEVVDDILVDLLLKERSLESFGGFLHELHRYQLVIGVDNLEGVGLSSVAHEANFSVVEGLEESIAIVESAQLREGDLIINKDLRVEFLMLRKRVATGGTDVGVHSGELGHEVELGEGT